MTQETFFWLFIAATVLFLVVPAARVLTRTTIEGVRAGGSITPISTWSAGSKSMLAGALGGLGCILFGGVTGVDIWAGGTLVVCGIITGAEKKKRKQAAQQDEKEKPLS